MAHVVNPIYDTVFKYIMQDEKVAKVLIGNILKTKVVSIYFPPNGISVNFFFFLLTIYKTEYPLFALL